MSESNFIHNWTAVTGSLAILALVVTSLGIIVGIVKPADALRRVAAILGVVMLLLVLPALLLDLRSGMHLWQRLGLAALGIAAWQWWRPRRRTTRRKAE